MRFLVAVLFLSIMYACGSAEWYNHQVNIPETGWHKDTVAVFHSEINELDKSCHLLVEVTNKESYKYSNIWFFIDAISPSGHIERDTLECYLANDDGSWYGKSLGDDLYESIHSYKLNIRFPEKGVYKYYVIHGMRDTVLTDVASVGLKIIEVE
ncbi:gliding motility lipoprotein GldH [Plebeiibacterium sediminum]|uniref:Gliding motility lipoprotein GldH n=1 Tax=Plebeiibacterium sediminum TaxID=2992112 RepID=A0AAE3SEA0_9BACT|nr:gliding motility lipoprotein GldH [Plebeiobacterium sediminum]MCW3785792.1 gliding motility lipoprotein GldH [Plebeiobacterium sediminum]